MRKTLYVIPLLAVLATACSNEPKEFTEAEKQVRDSLSKVEQKRRGDSLKKLNPLLILPPDSNYTGSYVDKYPNGIVKFKGLFRFGERHGQWLSFYPNGLMWSELHFDKGLRHGPNITYYDNGNMRYSGHYKNDQRDSIWIYYDTNGKPAKKVEFEKDAVVASTDLK